MRTRKPLKVVLPVRMGPVVPAFGVRTLLVEAFAVTVWPPAR